MYSVPLLFPIPSFFFSKLSNSISPRHLSSFVAWGNSLETVLRVMAHFGGRFPRFLVHLPVTAAERWNSDWIKIKFQCQNRNEKCIAFEHIFTFTCDINIRQIWQVLRTLNKIHPYRETNRINCSGSGLSRNHYTRIIITIRNKSKFKSNLLQNRCY